MWEEDLYSSYCLEPPLEFSHIENIFNSLGNRLGFQNDSVKNMLVHFMVQLDSRSSRMTPAQALVSLHRDYIGGEHANYRKWYFAVPLDLDDDPTLPAEFKWKEKMKSFSLESLTSQVALYLLIWGEANNVRFLPECLCFIYKCASDYLFTHKMENPPPESFLDSVITPLYNFIQNQQYVQVDGKLVRLEKDHCEIVGYDDMNQLFWFPEGIERLYLKDGTKLLDLPKQGWFLSLKDMDWERAFYKTYKEKRTWWHLATNFNRIWIIHLSVFWFYTSFNSPTLYTKHYVQVLNNPPSLHARFSSMALAGLVACIVQLCATLAEWSFVPRQWPGAQHLTKRLVLLSLVTLLNAIPAVYVFGFIPLNSYSVSASVVSIIHFIVAIFTVLFFVVKPLGSLCGSKPRSKRSKRHVSSKTFTASYAKLGSRGRVISISLWLIVFTAKFAESYFFLTLSLRDPIRDLSIMKMTRCHGDALFGNLLCVHQAKITLLLMYLTDLVLFFLDTYLWYVIINCVFSMALCFNLGISILTPWRNVFTRLPKRILSKILSTSEIQAKYKSKILVSQVWNAIVISMYRDHIISLEQMYSLVYHSAEGELKPPAFFIFQDDNSDFFASSNSEAQRRISFFAQSLSTPIPAPVSTEAMPAFTVMIPHYSEKIILGLREIIKESTNSKISLLEYLKQLFPSEWVCFVEETKAMAQDPSKTILQSQIDDLPYNCVGFKSSSPEYLLRTRLWASLRSQTLYRTVSGMMNYHVAIEILHRAECNDFEVAHKKFHLLVAMQRYQNFTDSEREDVRHLVKSFPQLKIASLERHDGVFYSVLYDCSCLDDMGDPIPKFKIKLSGNPILGDGKSDNQNHALIFYRGEFIQVIDANQDNYLEECFKIRSVLAEFEYDSPFEDPYVPEIAYSYQSPVAIVRAREYIFSENSGVLGDVAAGKEQTFGTLFARTLSEIGGKLHYGHPDFLNGIFMTTRGGISKAQKGLHLNEDIYAGMTALMRGGRIKHCDYYQCGKGRDLGFSSILNFTIKIGGGMGEQMLSREYYYLGTQLPLDRFLSFYYAHPGFHLNNLFIMLSVHLFMLVAINLGSLTHETILCEYHKDAPITDLQKPLGCYNLKPVLDWVSRFILSVFICFFISFLPLVIQEVSERGIIKAFTRLGAHFLSLSPFFEVFVCQIYSNSLINDIVFGGAKYISTGRGYAISRASFVDLYATYAHSSLYSGSRVFLIILFSTASMWQPALLWFWITLVSMCLAPLLFNPHEFVRYDFFLDYRNFIRWLFRGNSKHHNNCWIGFIRSSRSRFTGYKKGSEVPPVFCHRAPFVNTLFAEFFLPLCQAASAFIAYTFINAQNGVQEVNPTNSVLRLGILSFGPILVNLAILLVLFPLSCLSPIFSLCCQRVPSTMAGIAHCLAVLNHLVFFELTCALEGWSFSRSLAAFICCISIQRLFFQAIKIGMLTREMRQDYSNIAWWSGKWISRSVGIHWFTQPVREFLVKIVELSSFACDFFLGHWLLFALAPFLVVPYIDRWHSCMLFWLRPTKKYTGRLYSKREKKQRKARASRYAVLYFTLMILFIGMMIVPFVLGPMIPDLESMIPMDTHALFQPSKQENNDTGENAPSTVIRQKPTLEVWSTVY